MLVFFQKWPKPAQPNFLSLGLTMIYMLETHWNLSFEVGKCWNNDKPLLLFFLLLLLAAANNIKRQKKLRKIVFYFDMISKFWFRWIKLTIFDDFNKYVFYHAHNAHHSDKTGWNRFNLVGRTSLDAAETGNCRRYHWELVYFVLGSCRVCCVWTLINN